MKSLKDYVSLLEGSTVDGEKREQLKSDEVCAKEAENVDPEEVDIDSDADDVEEGVSADVLTLETAFVAADIINVSCCEAYITNPTNSTESKMVATMEASVKELWAKIKAFFKKIWNKIVAWFNKIKMYVLSVFMKGEKFIKKYKSEIESKLSTLASRELKYDGYQFNSVNNIDDGNYNSLKSACDAYVALAKDVEKKTKDELENSKKEYIDKVKDYDLDKYIENGKRSLYGDKVIFKLDANVIREEMKFVLTDKATILKDLNSASDEMTNLIRDAESKVKTFESKFNDDDTERKGAASEYCSGATQVISKFSSFVNGRSRLIVSYANARVSQAVVLCRKVLGGSATKESFDYNGSGTVLESVMNII